MGDRHDTCCHYQCDDCGQGTHFEEEILSSIVLSISTSIVFSTACYSYVLIFVRKEMNIITNKRNVYITRITMGSKKKKKKHLDGLSPQWGGGLGLSPLFMFLFLFLM